MRSDVTEISPVLVEVKVEVPWDDVHKGMEDGFARMQKTARIKGFRPGKVPRTVVKQVFAAQVRYEVLNALVEQSLLAAITEHQLEPVASPQVVPSPIKDGEPLSFTAKLEVRPKLEKVDTDGIEVARPAWDVGNDLVDREIERLRLENATIAAPEKARPAQKADLLVIDYAVTIDSKHQDDMSATDRTVELDGERLMPELEAGLLGAGVGDEKTIDVKFPDDHSNDQLRGKTATFRVTVKEIKERILPTLDDEFAKDCGDFKTLLELRLDVRKRLLEHAKTRSDGALRNLVVDRLIEKNPIPVPPSMIAQEEQRMAREFAQFLTMTGQTTTPLSEEMHKTMHARAERQMRGAILLGEIARREKIVVGNDEVEKLLAEIAERTGKHVAKVRVDYAGERREQLVSEILEGKLLDHLLSKATITDAVAAPTEAAAPGGTG